MDTEYIRSLRHAAGNAATLARMMGVSKVTVESWCTGRRAPGDVERRLLYVLGVLLTESPALFDAVARPGTFKPTFPKLPPVVPRVARTPEAEWDDEYWHNRTVSREDWEMGIYPLVEVSAATFDRMSEAQEARWVAALSAYEKRTGRLKPE